MIYHKREEKSGYKIDYYRFGGSKPYKIVPKDSSYFDRNLKYKDKARKNKLLNKKALVGNKINVLDYTTKEKQEFLKIINQNVNNKIHYIEFKNKEIK